MKTADLFKREHDAILESCKVLDYMCGLLNSGRSVPLEDLAIILEFIEEFTFKYHLLREESIAFPAMEAAGILNRYGLIGDMIAEHHAMKGYVRLMEDSLAHNPFHRDKFIKGAEDYVEMMRSHIEKETDELFPLADSRMDQESVGKLSRELEQFELTVTGKGRLDELYRMPGHLRSEYPG